MTATGGAAKSGGARLIAAATISASASVATMVAAAAGPRPTAALLDRRPGFRDASRRRMHFIDAGENRGRSRCILTALQSHLA
jgi:hypothetical protein